MKFDPVQIITSGDMAQSAINSKGIDLNQQYVYAIQAVWTGSPVGTLKIQVSNDIVPDGVGGDQASNVVNWTDYTNSSQSISGAGNFVWNVLEAGYRWVRLVYTKTSGSGTINAVFSGKGA